jgi:hypothetical protein
MTQEVGSQNHEGQTEMWAEYEPGALKIED